MTTTTIAPPLPAARSPLYKSLFVQVLVALLLGIVIGVLWPDFAIGLKVLSDGFLKLITMIVAPIVFCVVVHGIAGAGDLKKVGRVGVKALVYFEVMTTVALVIGLMLAFVFGARPRHEHRSGDARRQGHEHLCGQRPQAQGGGIASFLLNIIPTTSFDALARNDVLQVLFFAIIFGVSLALVGGDKGEQVGSLIDAVSTVLFKAMGLIVRVAPLGVLGAVAYTVGRYGVGSLKQLISLVVLFYASVAIFVLGDPRRRDAACRTEHPQVPGVPARGTDDRSRHRVVRRGAAADHAQARAHGRARRSVVGLVIPTGYSFNLDAFSIYLTLAAVFIAQATNTPLSLGDLLLVLGGFAGHLEGRPRRARFGNRDPGSDAERGADDPGDRSRPGAVGRLVHRHGAGARQSDRQLRRHRRDRGVGEGYRSRHRQKGAGRRGHGRRHCGLKKPCPPACVRRRSATPGFPLAWPRSATKLGAYPARADLRLKKR